MGRVVGLVAGLLWVTGLVLLVVAATQINVPTKIVQPAPGQNGIRDNVLGLLVITDHGPMWLLYVGIALVGVAGLLTGGSVLRQQRRPTG